MIEHGGPCVIVTRPARDAAAWVQWLTASGVQAVGLPLIDILPVDDASLVHQAWRDLHDYAAVMFVSANAVTGFFESKPLASQWALTHTTNTTPPRVWATGPGTVAVLQQSDVPLDGVDAPPPEAAQFDSEALWQQVSAQVRVGQRVLIVRGGDAQQTPTAQGVVGGLNVGQDLGAGRDWLAARLRASGVVVDFVVAYRRGLPCWSSAQVQRARDAACDGSIWLFSSSEAVANLRTLVPGQDWSVARAVATHARIAVAARALGFGVVRESRPMRADMMGSIESVINER